MSTTTMKERLAESKRRHDQREAQAEIDQLRVEAEVAEACKPFVTAFEAGLKSLGTDAPRSRHG